MRSHIDWLTFTLTPRWTDVDYERTPDEEYADSIGTAFMDIFGKELVADAFGGNWEKNEFSRAPYVDAWKLADGNTTLFASPTLTHCCVEISGKGCERLIEAGLLGMVLAHCRERVTRIDIACDIKTPVRPLEFVERLSGARMRSSGYQKSDSGETCYVGSQKSERYARVYRYEEPHPRSDLLRIEHVFRRDHAKEVARAISRSGIEAVSFSAGRAFGWAHPVWVPTEVQDIDLSPVRMERAAGKTVYWLVHSVAPAFARLCADGTIQDPEQFIKAHFLPQE